MPLSAQILGARISQLRELRRLSLGELAEASGGIAKSYLAKLERGEVANPGLRTLTGIAKALDVTVADLVKSNTETSSARRDAVLSEQVEFERLVSKLPSGLQEFLDQLESRGESVPAGTIRALAHAEFRGKRPETAADWQFLYDALARSVR